MLFKNSNKYFIIFPVFILIVFSLISCGSGSDSGVSLNNKSGTGSVAILLTDSPTDDFSEINITVTNIEFLSDDSIVSVFSGNKSGNKILNLLDLKNETILFSIENNVPAISYNKIRLTVSNVELIDKKGQPVIKPVKLGGNGKIDLNPRMPFSVSPGEMLALQLDLDAEKSLKLDENRNRYNFRPVVFIDIIEDVPPEKLLRMKGIVLDIDLINKKFRLCPDKNDVDSYTGSSNYDNNNDSCCITVYVSDDTSFFSSENEGHPVPFEGLPEGSSSSIIGFYKTDSYMNDDSKSCNLGLDAIVVETGNFIKLTGTIVSEVNSVTHQFDFHVDPNQAVGSVNPIKVALQEGTKVYSTRGVALEKSELKVNIMAEIDGKIILDPDPIVPDVLNAAFVSVDTDSITLDKLSGEIDNINDSAGTFDLITTDKTVCVEVTDDVQIFLIKENGTLVSQMITFQALDNGNQVDIYDGNNSTSGCFIANTIIAFETE